MPNTSGVRFIANYRSGVGGRHVVATALIFALEPQARFQKGFKAFWPFPSPTNTIALVFQSITMVKHLFFLPK